jgi:CofD-related protein of GAK system
VAHTDQTETRVRLTRSVRIPHPVRLARLQRVPELGPRLLFFSGGTALRRCCQALIGRSHNSIHLITPFDSGGSSAVLRKAFHMPAVGDLRNRLLALADRSIQGQPEIFRLFAFRFPADGEQRRLGAWLRRMADGRDPMVAAVRDPMRKIIRSHLRFFIEQAPAEFDLRGANVGNLVLTGGYLNQNRHLDPVCFLFSKLVEVRGVVRPVASENLHLVAELADGQTLVGQHELTGKQVAPIDSPVERIYLSRRQRQPEPYVLPVRDKVGWQVGRADLICYPMGSFYSSLVVNLLLAGMGAAVAASPALKVYVPNTGGDPEQLGLALDGQVRALLEALRRDENRRLATEQLLQYVLVDPVMARAERGPLRAVSRLGVEVIEVPLVSEASSPWIDPGWLADVLVSLVG